MSQKPPDESADAAHKEPNGERRDSVYRRLCKAAFRAFPSITSDPHFRESLRQLREMDDEQNNKTEPPRDEVIDLRCIWAIEFYTPSQVARLLEKFEGLGWNINDLGSADNPSTWIRQFRDSAHGGGWYNLGPLHRPNERRCHSPGRSAPLPVGVDYALASMYSLTSSITCIVVGFILDDSVSSRFEESMRKPRQTMAEPLPDGGYIFRDPPRQKADDIKAVRGELRKVATDWFRTCLPGLFSGQGMDGELPTCEFVVLQKSTPLPSGEERDRETEAWLRLLDLDHDFDAWHADRVPGLKFSWPRWRNSDMRFHGVLAARKDTFPEEDLQMYSGKDRISGVIYVDHLVNALLGRWGLLGVLAHFERHLNLIRDSRAFDPESATRPLPIINAFGSEIARSIDIAPAAADLKRFAMQRRLFDHNLATFKPCDKRFYRDADIALTKAIQKEIIERSEWLENTDKSIRDLLTQYASILGSRENIRLQQRIGRLTWVLIGLTVLIAVLTVIVSDISWP